MAANVAEGKEVESSRHIDQSNHSVSDSFSGQLSPEEHPEDTQETTATNGDSNDKASDDNNKQPYIIKILNGKKLLVNNTIVQVIKYFDHPVLSTVEDKVGESFNIIEDSNMTEEHDDVEESELPQHILEHASGIYNTMKEIEKLIAYEKVMDEGEEKTQSSNLPTLDAISHASLIGHCLAAYVSTLSESHIKTISSKILSDCQFMLTRLFKFPDASAYYHKEEYDGLVKACKLALHQKYPKYSTEGFEALYSRPPVIYFSAAAPASLGQSLCMQLGLPISCISTVPCNSVSGANSKMDVTIFEKLIKDDIAAAKTPVLLVAYAGTPLTGQVDELIKLWQICNNNGIWCHVDGNCLAFLTLTADPLTEQRPILADSITVNLGKWLGILSLQLITLYKCEDTTMAYMAGMNSFNVVSKLSCLPLWICLQSMGYDGIIKRIESSFHLCHLMLKKLRNLPNIKIVNIEKKQDDEEKEDDENKDMQHMMDINSNPVTLLFKYSVIESDAEKEITPYVIKSSEESCEQEKELAYYDALNTWLADLLSRENPQLAITAAIVDKGVCIRFSPIETAQVSGTTEEAVEDFILSLQTQTAILDATVSQRKQFQNIVANCENLMLIEMEGYAGLGAIRYIPASWSEKLAELPENGKNDINTLNIELVHKLKSTDSAFSLGQCADNIACVKFGLITADTEIDELVSLVETVGKQLEESSKFLETMSERILKGIEEASKDLQRENHERIIQEGLLRQVPLVGSLLNWWSPPPKEVLKGRTFDLSSGRIISTETTYKYHMQIQEDSDNAKNASSLPSPDANEMAVQLHVTTQHVDSTHDTTLEDGASDKHEQSVSDDKDDDAAASKATEEESGNSVQNIPSPGAETTSEENPIVNTASEQITTTEGELATTESSELTQK
ncbi:pyridoxal-dependent decarboxylase domain-containing protein 1 isoform X1 [Octopus bimaculoides]|nr:pyridoxal-dependent decarboxylase domain-containing protein 1 isoform X1 [Octopus bimaculoides]